MFKCDIGFMGSGNMAHAIAMGIINAGMLPANKIAMYDIDENRLNTLRTEGFYATNSIEDATKSCKYLFLAVLPQICGELLSKMKEFMIDEQVIVSIAAGISSNFIKSNTTDGCKVILVMPNTPLMVCSSSTALARIEPTPVGEFNYIVNLFGASGHTQELPENLMKEVIPLNGSSPAFLYRLTLSVVDKAEELGFGRDEANKLFCHAMIGAAQMMLKTGKSHEELIEMVSSPGGATIQGLKSLEENDINKTVSDCIDKTIKRAYELGR